MIWNIMAWLLPILAILAASMIPIGLGALLRLLFSRMNRNLPTLLAAAILLFLQEKLFPGALSTMLSTVMSVSPEGNAGRSTAMLIILVMYPLAGLAIPFIFAWIGASFVDRTRNKRNPNQDPHSTSVTAPGAGQGS